ncbi:MAG: recombinase family protein, partial [Candidatus Eisenbacteria bacterium]
MKPVTYARVSTEKQEKQETIQSQVVALRTFAGGNGSANCKEYTDDGYTGELLGRPALDRLRDDAKKGLFDTVLVHSPDRLSRSFIHLGILQEELAKAGVKIKYLNRPESKDTPEEKLLENVQGVIAEYEKTKILERTRRGRLHKAQSGFVIGGWAPYGYRYVLGDRNKKEPGHYEVAPEEARVVRLIFRMLVHDGLSVRGIAKELVMRGMSPRQGKCWRHGTVQRIVRNETYIGTTYYGKFASVEPKRFRTGAVYRRTKNSSKRLRPKDQWTAIPLPESLEIVDRKTFELAQKQLKVNAERSQRNVKHDYLLRNLFKCGECGAPMYGMASRGRLAYRCGDRARTFPLKSQCRGGSVTARWVEDAVWEKVCEAVANPELILS